MTWVEEAGGKLGLGGWCASLLKEVGLKEPEMLSAGLYFILCYWEQINEWIIIFTRGPFSNRMFEKACRTEDLSGVRYLSVTLVSNFLQVKPNVS